MCFYCPSHFFRLLIAGAKRFKDRSRSIACYYWFCPVRKLKVVGGVRSTYYWVVKTELKDLWGHDDILPRESILFFIYLQNCEPHCTTQVLH